MVDFSKQIKNSDKFREPALQFIATGHYCTYPEGTAEFFKYWDEQMNRCKYGYTADDGDFISGYNYFYLNFCPIQRIVYTTITNPDGSTKIKKTRDLQFPDFYDYDYYFFQAMEEAEEQGKHLCALKSRRKGYSYKNAAMACRNYYLFPGSKTYIYASNKQYLTEDGILTKAWDYMDFIDKNTAWGKKRSVNTQMRKRAGFYTKDEYGNEVELGFKSEIIGVTLKDNPDVVRGKAGKLIIFEEAGSFAELGAAWQIARPSVEQDGIAFGVMVAFGTGGDEDSHFETLKDMFYNPEGYNCLGFDNIWDETLSDKKCGFFIPQYTNMDFRDENGNRIYMDNDGNTLRKKSVEYILQERRKVVENSTNSVAVDRYVAEHCLDGDTWISTEDGVTKIKDNPKAWVSGVKDVYKLTTEDGAELLLTDNHKVFNGKEYKELKEYKIGDTIKYYNTEFSETYQYINVPGLIPATNTSIRIDEDWALFIGLFMGDGCFYGPTGALCITFDNKDVNSIEWCKQFLEQNFGKCSSTIIGKLKGGTELRVVRKHSTEILKALQLLKSSSNGSLKRKVHVPEYILKSPKTVVSAFLKGLFDSDGYSSKDGNHIGFCNKEKQLLLDMQFLLRGFDIHCSVRARVATNGHNRQYTENKLNIRKADIPKFREQIGFLSKRKNNNIINTIPLRIIKDYSFGIIKNIEYVKTDTVWDINTITHALSANGIWVHNCITPQEACLEFGGNIFPKKELQEQLARIRTSKSLSNMKQIGDLVWESDGSLKWIIKKQGDITHYPLKKDDDPTGSIVIWEHPMKDAPVGLYIGGCLLPGEKVLTDKGLKDVEKVDHNDMLINQYGEKCRIKVFQRRHKQDHDSYIVTPFSSYRSTTFTKEHPILTVDGFKQASELTEQDTLVIPNRYLNANKDYITYLNKLDGIDPNCKEFWWFLGVWLGDGCTNINMKPYDIYCAFGIKQEQESKEYDRVIRKVFDRKTIVCKANGGNTRRFTHKQLCLFLNEQFGKYASNKKIPEWVKTAPTELKQSFLLGYLDADGSVFLDKGRVRVNFTSINLELLEAIQDILFAYHIKNSIVIHQKECVSYFNSKPYISKLSYRINILSESIKYMFKDLHISINSNKLNKLKTHYKEYAIKVQHNIQFDCDRIYLKVKQIVKTKYTGTVYNFECDTHTYMCRNIVTHNCDPYDFDQSGTNSLGSCFIYKRFQNFENYYDVVVAEYTGRPSTAEEFYENVRKLIIYYNGRLMYENQNKGLFSYFIAKHCDYLLADQPDIINDIVQNSKVQRKKGCHMNKQIKQWAEGLIKDWLNEEKSPGKKNLHEILSEPLLEELISYNDTGNFDRVCALFQIMIYREQLYNLKVKEKKEENKNRILFEGPIFTQDWYHDDDIIDDNIKTYMF